MTLETVWDSVRARTTAEASLDGIGEKPASRLINFAELVAYTALAAGVVGFLIIGGAYVVVGSGPSRDVVATQFSPSGTAQAVVEEVNGGATTSFGYRVYLQQSDARPADSRVLVAQAYGATRNANAYGLNAVWRGASSLEIQYYKAKSIELIKPKVQLGAAEVTVQLRGEVSDPNAPPGGMLYNLQGRPALK